MLSSIDVIKIMLTMRKINNDLADEVEYISTTDDLTTGRFTVDELINIYELADSLSKILQNSKRDYYEYIAICEAIKVRAEFILIKL